MTNQGQAGPGWTKDRAGAVFAGAAVFFFVSASALEWTKRALPDYAYTVANLLALVAGAGAYWLALRVMRRLP